MALSKEYQMQLKYYNDKFKKDTVLREIFPDVSAEIIENVTIDSVYMAIGMISGDKNRLSFLLSVYKDSTRRCELEELNYSFVPNVVDDSENFIKQGYEYLKTLDEYADATDC